MITEFCKILVVNPDDVLGESRRPAYTLPRMLYWKLMRREGYTLAEIGRLNGRHHSTVIHALRRANELIEVDREVRAMWERVEGIKRHLSII